MTEYPLSESRRRPRSGDDDARLADPEEYRANCGVGVVMDLAGEGGNDVLADGLDLLENLEHRGTTGAEENTGDGAGVLLRKPHDFFADELDAELPDPDAYAVGSLFFPKDDTARERLQSLSESVLADEGLDLFAWRRVPTGDADLGRTALESEPDVWQCFVRPADEAEAEAEGDREGDRRGETGDPDADGFDPEAFDRDLYVARRVLERSVEGVDLAGSDRFYVCSLDRRTLVYKGLLKGEQLPAYFPDLRDDRFETTFAMVHARFSTNTLGAWHLAHPYRNVIHNGEFNTIRGNVNWMRARENDLESDAFDPEKVTPVVADPEGSDTAAVDNSLELLLQGGRDLPHALRLMVPEAWRKDERMADERREFYDFHASLLEPWDGPALVAATDGERVGAVLDRNGLRPCRYDVTTDDRLVMASEAGALDTPESEIRERGRLEPGQLFLADPDEGGVIPDEEVFADLTDERYGEWVAEEQVQLDAVADADADADPRASATPDARLDASLRERQTAFGYTRDELDELLEPMAESGKDPVGSMGDDTPLSVLSSFDRPLFSYFKQLFAQVSNPPIDYLREDCVTSLESRLGNQRNLLDESPAHARQLVLDSPVLTDAEMTDVREQGEIPTATVDVTYAPETDLETALRRVRQEAGEAVEDGAEILVLSDRDVGPDRLAIPSLLATGAVHHHLVRRGLRNRTGLVVESGDPRTVHHLACLVGYGAGAVNPTLAFESIADIVAGPDGVDEAEAVEAYVAALEDGLQKTMSKMGISTVESYRGAQIFEAVGLDSEFVEEYFEGTPARTEGIGVEGVEEAVRRRHREAFDRDAGSESEEGGESEDAPEPERQGEFEHRSNGRRHEWNPETVGTLQRAVREGDPETYAEFAAAADDHNDGPRTLRGLLDFDSSGRESIPVEEVESVESIVKRFSTAAMSLGSLSPEAHENNAVAMNRLGAKSNTGEGGEPPERFGTERECNVKQVASGRFGVTSAYLANADEIQIKMAQGSKPGEGGHLPGSKVNEMIAHVRYATPGVGLISPPPQHDIYSIEDLKQLVYDLKSANPDADVNVKLVSEDGIGTIAAGVAKANADVVHISGHSGGTGASPRTSIKHAGLPWELGLAEANQMLRETGLRSRIRVSVDGGLKTGRDVAVAALLGAEEYVFGTASLVTSGCVMARQCHENTCPVGVATQREDLRERFPGEPDHVVNYMTFVAQELREIMAELGFETIEGMVGRVECLHQRETDHPKARELDLSGIVADPVDYDPDEPRRTKTREQTHEIEDHLDRDLLALAQEAVEDADPAHVETDVGNEDRAVGAMLSGRISEIHGEGGLPTGTLSVDFRGTAGQSFGAFLQSGVDLHLTGAANDYLGKGLSGGRIAVSTPDSAAYDPTENVVVGNVALYGATGGEAYVNGVAGERFGVRNSGVKAVVEGVGDHGCEYMTGGVVAVLGETGRNFAAGMSGGVAYVLDGVAPEEQRDGDGETVGASGDFAEKVNPGMVNLESSLSERDENVLRRLVENHAAYTDSERAAELLADWDAALSSFVKVMPEAYERAVTEEGRKDVRNSLPSQAWSREESGRVVQSGAD
ncbi:glutamate synthase large subunit [Halorussus gelatinilyticus]|uniref:Glutamate synthase large subunit n=1 Tax=Halorussus gelatinilyticus TaxID=2937524 RepID=A0A8U0IEF2_9EURY|nr:glutamate synthase large subunit [Halorussus gelatinilyticus]UPV99446.1 glutamate synthase large subunit [Halorussus gelatinilyticus]